MRRALPLKMVRDVMTYWVRTGGPFRCNFLRSQDVRDDVPKLHILQGGQVRQAPQTQAEAEALAQEMAANAQAIAAQALSASAQAARVAQGEAPQTPSAITGASTVQEAEGLRMRLSLLRDELQDAASRRRTIASQLRSTDSKAVPGLERRMSELDDRIIALEREITTTGLRLTSTSPEILSQAAQVSSSDIDPNVLANNIVDEIVPIVAIISIFVLAPIGLAISRLIWKRASAPRRAPVDTGTQQRLEGLQQSVDTIAIEVERISEGQRFVTRLLSDRERSLLGAEGARK